MIAGNHEPALARIDDAARRRFNIIPFIHKPEKTDKVLLEKLRLEWPGILRWMINGCLAWQRDGLTPPETVRAATAGYFDNQDLFAQWVEEECDACPGDASICDTSSNLFNSWSQFARAAGDQPGTRKSFARLLERRGFEPCRLHGGVRAWRGIRVRPHKSSGG